MKWSAMTPEQRNALVAEKVMGWTPKECNGEIGEQPISPDGWACQKCQYRGYWGDDTTHAEVPMRYSEHIYCAWQIVEHFRIHRFDVHVGSAPLQYDVAILNRRMGGKGYTASAES